MLWNIYKSMANNSDKKNATRCFILSQEQHELVPNWNLERSLGVRRNCQNKILGPTGSPYSAGAKSCHFVTDSFIVPVFSQSRFLHFLASCSRRRARCLITCWNRPFRWRLSCFCPQCWSWCLRSQLKRRMSSRCTACSSMTYRDRTTVHTSSEHAATLSFHLRSLKTISNTSVIGLFTVCRSCPVKVYTTHYTVSMLFKC